MIFIDISVLKNWGRFSRLWEVWQITATIEQINALFAPLWGVYFVLRTILGILMIDNQTINRLSEQINALLPPGLQQVKEDFDARLKSLLQQQLTHYEMVSREEFDIQARVLARTREKLEVIEARLKELEKTLD
jgi:BMFP domain-containing protein YqiC